MESSIRILITLMLIELGVGILSGLITKAIVKFKARNSTENQRTFSAGEYSSQSFGNKLPESSFNTFNLNHEFIIVSYSNNEIVREDFYTPLGDHARVEYTDGRLQEINTKFWSSPTYNLVVFIPALIGFGWCAINFERYTQSSPLSTWDQLGICFIVSSVLWLSILYLIPMYVRAFTEASSKSTNSPE